MIRIFLALLLLVTSAKAQMQTAEIGWENGGIYLIGGATTIRDWYWPNNTGQNIYIWGIQGELWFSGMIVASAPVSSYLANVADLGMTFRLWNGNDGTLLRQIGWDHYDNASGPQDHVCWFPRPFIMPPGYAIHLNAHGGNGFQTIYGGELVYNANGLIYYTVGAP